MSKVAVVSFPGNNCEVESLEALRRNGIEAMFFRWNDDRSKLNDVDGYFVPGGFSYEDHGRAGMVAGRDSLMDFIGSEAEAGKVVVGSCNGAQILVESGLVPLGASLDMCLAKNLSANEPVGFLGQWVWITPSCARNRCAVSDWEGSMHLPIAHGEGRFTTRDKDLYQELKKNDQVVFSYCDEEGSVSEKVGVTPNGSALSIAGICNPAGNVIALMPHPERTRNGDRYFHSMKSWMKKHSRIAVASAPRKSSGSPSASLSYERPASVEIFIDTLIVNNEERTVESAARRLEPSLRLKQLAYVPISGDPSSYLGHVSHFNPSKQVAYIRRGCDTFRWDAHACREERQDASVLNGMKILRRDEPFLSEGSPGICYLINGIAAAKISSSKLLEIFANPHASTLTLLQ